ncbi:MAG: DNA gyrase subunit A [Bacteroidales bacterium]|nr:DNA gyrase subunit A [Bacteroidales bacterium]MDD3914557.1 DNA gyrase subunit A [Bacteroidales bacterium]MDD4634451.1 DNA gyrase subunit A [Bacteroidales bacterium]
MMDQLGEKIVQVNIEEQMKSAYIDYSMSVIVSRALPDVRDGLKPVHRRVLFGMNELGVKSNTSYKKSARIVGEVLGKFHPHGDSSVYDAMVRLAQDWSMRYRMVDGQGNFGSIDGDGAAAMRYTEARLTKLAEEMLADINKNTVDFQLNFDDSLEEPVVLPARIPYLLVNGASGIAVGMATNMAPHNLSDTIDTIIAYIDNRDIEIPELMKYIKAPDFPTAGIIYGYEGVRDAYETGRGRIVLRGESTIEVDHSGRESIIVTSIPYQINKSEMIRKTADLVNDKKLEGISDIRDESDRNGMRIVYELKRDAVSSVVLNKLYQFTQLQSSFSVNNICLVHGRPMLLNLKQLISYYVDHRHDVLIRKTQFDLSEAEKRAHIIQGLIIATDNIDEVIRIIKESNTPEIAKTNLIDRFGLSEIQAKAILDMRLAKLTGLERDKLHEEYAELLEKIKYYNTVLNDYDLRMTLLKQEFTDVKEQYGDARKTQIVYASSDFRMEDLINNEKVVVTITRMGYIKRTPLAEYRSQRRGGKGAKGSGARDEDFIEHIFVADTHNYMLFFTNSGKCFWIKVYEIPEGAKASKGRAIQNLIAIPKEDKIKAYINVDNLTDEDYINNNNIILCTKSGIIKKTTLAAYSRPRTNGIIAINIRENDELLEARLTNGTNEVILATSKGRAIRFHEAKVRPMGRNATGVKGVTLNGDDDCVVGMVCPDTQSETDILVVSEHGFGKKSKLEDYRFTNRGGKGVLTMNITEKTGTVIAIKDVSEFDDIIIITISGLLIRMAVSQMRTVGRATQGVKLIDIRENDAIAAVTQVKMTAEERKEEEEEEEENKKDIDELDDINTDDDTNNEDNTSDNE